MNVSMYLFCVSRPVVLVVKEQDFAGRQTLQYDLRVGVGEQSAQELHGDLDARLVTLRAHPPDCVGDDSLYIGLGYAFLRQLVDLTKRYGRSIVRVLTKSQERTLLRSLSTPVQLGYASPVAATLEAQLDAIDRCSTTTLRVGIINVSASALGDSIVAITAVREFRNRVLQRFPRIRITSFQHPDNVEAEQLWIKSGAVDELVPLPAPLANLTSQHAYVDMSAPYFGSSRDPYGVWNQQHWLDRTLATFGIDPASVADEAKRNRLHVDLSVQQELASDVQCCKARGLPLVMFHPLASVATRSIPRRLVPEMLVTILERRQWMVVSAVPIEFAHSRFVDWSHLSASFEHLNVLLSVVDAFISVDTSVSHIADAHDVPGVVLYSWVAPESRVRYYPYIEGVRLPQDHGVKRDSRDWRAISRVHRSWDRLDLHAVLRILDRLMERASRGGS